MRTIVLTGGGSAGHVTPHMAVLPKLREAGWHIEYIGSENGIERQIIEQTGGIPYHGIASGKLRRYFDLKNFTDPFKVVKGLSQAYKLLGRLKPKVVFSKGGFVTVPVILAAKLRGIPVVIHESDFTPGLANRISAPFASRICVTFPETVPHFREGKAVCTGSPVRSELLEGSASRARHLCGFVQSRPVLLVVGGSLGSQVMNRAVRSSLDTLLETFQVVHVCGKGQLDEELERRRGYKQFEYVSDGLPDLMALADAAVSRAGANFIFEFLALRKPMLLVPLSKQASRGDQLLNAASFERSGFCSVLQEEELSDTRFVEAVMELYSQREKYIAAMSTAGSHGGADAVFAVIESAASRA